MGRPDGKGTTGRDRNGDLADDAAQAGELGAAGRWAARPDQRGLRAGIGVDQGHGHLRLPRMGRRGRDTVPITPNERPTRALPPAWLVWVAPSSMGPVITAGLSEPELTASTGWPPDGPNGQAVTPPEPPAAAAA